MTTDWNAEFDREIRPLIEQTKKKGWDCEFDKRVLPLVLELEMSVSNYEDPREPGDPPEISPIVALGSAFVVVALLLWLLLTFGPLWWGK